MNDDSTAQALAIIYVSTDDGETWSAVNPVSVPDWLKEPDVMANLLHGECAQNRMFPMVWYRAQKIEAPTMDTKQ
jgi:hypothetical protein